mmetsp:Transcript_41729/g.116331  ORF Transcript_41729/g.116331 Transcript_41729/m.116331 type:complete len:212 (-) Transcript_41729:674-1309(-)
MKSSGKRLPTHVSAKGLRAEASLRCTLLAACLWLGTRSLCQEILQTVVLPEGRLPAQTQPTRGQRLGHLAAKVHQVIMPWPQLHVDQRGGAVVLDEALADSTVDGVVAVHDAIGAEPVKEGHSEVCAEDWRQQAQGHALGLVAHRQQDLAAEVLGSPVALSRAEGLKRYATSYLRVVPVLHQKLGRQVAHCTDEGEVQGALFVAHALVQQP